MYIYIYMYSVIILIISVYLTISPYLCARGEGAAHAVGGLCPGRAVGGGKSIAKGNLL